MKKLISTLIILSAFVSFMKINTVHCLENSKNENKSVYITFDDGPNENTLKILDLLEKHNMKATFFLLNDKINLYPNIVSKILSEGHSVGLHGKSHEVTVFYANELSALDEINITRNTLKESLGYDTVLVRVPYGSKPHLTDEQYNNLINSGYKIWDWNIDSTDTHPNANTNSVVSNTLNQLKSKKSSVVLFHDKQVTVNALSSILNYLKENNYESKTIDQNQPPMNWQNKNFY
jgi:peptidoglycan-N-acetylglucosamine deacetylase